MPAVGQNGTIQPDVAPSTLTVDEGSVRFFDACPINGSNLNSAFGGNVKCGYVTAADSLTGLCR